MNVELSIAVYQTKVHDQLSWTTVGLGPHTEHLTGRSHVKLQRKLVDTLQKKLARGDEEGVDRDDLIWFRIHRGTRLVRIRAELILEGGMARRRLSGRFPLIVVPRFVNDDERRLVVFHPQHTTRWFSPRDENRLEEEASLFLRHIWADQTEEQIRFLETDGKDRLLFISFNASVPSLLDGLDEDDDKKKKRAEQDQSGGPVLVKVGSDQTLRAVEGTLPTGTPREPYRRQLQQLIAGQHKRSVVVIGNSQVGKSTIIQQAIADLLDAEDFPTHRNLDKVHHVWNVNGKRIIAGMSYLGDWEQRCLDLLTECKKKRAIVWLEDLHLFGQLGRTRQSDRNLATFFQGPVQSGSVVMIGECTPEQWQRLEDDAPSFATLFTKIHVHPTDDAQTLAMLVTEARQLEQAQGASFHPFCYRTIVELSGSLFPWAAFPGKAMELLRQLADRHRDTTRSLETAVSPNDVIALASAKTGLPESMLTLERPLDATALRRGFSGRVMGQGASVDAACRLVFRIRSGLTDPKRPYAVMLFTGPTGTGKTEMARCIAEYLYGNASRLMRLDMSEYATPDAVARLIGDRWEPEGLLTQRIREQPFSVLLLDEIEKAHRSVLYLLLQLFDEGRLTDAAGNTASFHQTVVIMTSNLGAKPTRPIGFGASMASVLADIAKAVREFFPPELFNRMDEVVPFRPLTEEVAESIATKELAGLLSRRGLRERNIFVYANRAVKRRIVEEAFDARHGARTVKRYLEDRIGSLLADEVARQSRASMQVVRIYEQDGDFRLHVDPLTETEPASLTLPLEPLLALPALTIRDRALPTALAELEALDVGAAVSEARDAIARGDAPQTLLYWLDWYRSRVDALVDQMRQRLRGKGDDPHLMEAQLFSHDTLPVHGGQRVRVYDRRAASSTIAAASKDELLENLAEARFVIRHLHDLSRSDGHAVHVELLRMGVSGARNRPSGMSLLERLVRAYATGDRLETMAWRDADGRSRTGAEAAWESPPVHAALHLSGFGIRDRLACEEGCHIWRSPSSEPEIVRVRLLHPVEGGPAEVLAAHHRARKAFEAALDEGRDELPDNPERLDPAVRTYQFRPPVEEGNAPFAVELEDFRLGWAGSLNVTKLEHAVRQLGWLWLARGRYRAVTTEDRS